MNETEKIESSLPNINSEIIKDILRADANSPLKKQMELGERYFKGDHDICHKKLNEYTVMGDRTNQETGQKEIVKKTIEIPNRSLVKVEHRYHWKLVKQKRDYTVGKPITISYEPLIDEELTQEQQKAFKKEKKVIVDKFWNILGIGFDNFVRQAIVNMSNKIFDTWYIYYDEQGNFRYTQIDSKEIIPIYDAKTQKTLTDIFHVYRIVENGKEKVYVEWATSKETTYFVQDKNETARTEEYLIDEARTNPEPHWVTQTLFNGKLDNIEEHSWGKVPYIIVKNNEEMQSDLEPIKNLSDAYDLINSNFINTMEDLKEFIYKINGYGAEDLTELLERIKIMGIVRNNDTTGSVDVETIPFPYEARQILLKLLEEKIYEFGRGVNTNRSELIGQAPSGVSLGFLYTDLDSKSDDCINSLRQALYELFWFISEHLKRTGEIPQDLNIFDFKFTFNKSRIFNETEKIQAINQDTTLSLRTKLENHPYVDDVEQELQRLKEEHEKELRQYEDIIPNRKKTDGEEDEE